MTISRTIIRIPTAPLLLFLDECEGAAEDSGFENSSRPRRDTTETRYAWGDGRGGYGNEGRGRGGRGM